MCKRRKRGRCHRDRAPVPGLDLGHQREQGGADHVTAGRCLGLVVKTVQAGADRRLHELVVRGMEVDPVEALAVAVVGVEDRIVAIRLEPPAQHFGGPDPGTDLGEKDPRPIRRHRP